MNKKKIFVVLIGFIIGIAVGSTVFVTTEIMDSNSGSDSSSSTYSSINDVLSDNALRNETPDFLYDGFYVDGTKLYDAQGNEFVMRGVNHAHTWFKNMTDTALEAIADTGSNTVRVVLSDGGQWDKDSLDNVREIVEKCKELNMVAMLEVHDATGMNDMQSLQKAVDYWIEIKDVLIGNEAYVLLNIANEWVGEWDSEIWRDGYTSAIPQLRDAGIRNMIVVDAGGWGQYAESVHIYAKEVFDSDKLENTMFSIHMYGTAGKDAATIKRNIDGVTEQGYCVIIGEFGFNHHDGDVDEKYIMSYCTEQNIGYLGWSWHGNGTEVMYLDIADKWDGSVLSEHWGEKLINGENGIRATSEICSVFE